jgi:hypothetical protein
MTHIKTITTGKAIDSTGAIFLQIWATVFSLILSLGIGSAKR